MKDGFKSIAVEPFNGYLDFQGPINSQKPAGSLTLKGDIRLELTKAIKVKRATIKFKGASRVCHQNTLDIIDVSTPILPKLKTQLFTSSTVLGPGEVTLPWEMEILNIYPCSVMIKRVSIHYKIELTIHLGLHRKVTAEYPIVIRRHLLPCLAVAPLVPTKLYTKTISTKFHYEIDAPRIVCIAQESIPIAIKLLSIGSQKRVLSIRTQIIQIELYRCNTLPKTDADMTKFKTQLLSDKSTSSPAFTAMATRTTATSTAGATPTISQLSATTSSSSSLLSISGNHSAKKGESKKYAKYSKRTTPAVIHTLDETQMITSTQPLLIRHPLAEYLTLGLESPLAAIYHQLEITFQFGAKFEDIRAKLPILIASAGPSASITPHPSTDAQHQLEHQQSLPLALYPYEKIAFTEPLMVTDESRVDRNRSATKIPTPSADSSDTAIEDDEVGDILEMIANYSGHRTNDSTRDKEDREKSSPHLSSLTPVRSPSQLLRRARSAANLTTSAPTNTMELHIKKDTLNRLAGLSHHPSQQQRLFNASTTLPPQARPPTMTAQQWHLLNSNTELAAGMWPRPETEVPHQWRRRSSSQPYISNDGTPTRPVKDTERYANRSVTPSSATSTTGKSPLKNSQSYAPVLPVPALSRRLPLSPPDNVDSMYTDGDSFTDISESSSYMSSSLSSGMSHTNSSSYELHELQSRPNSPAFPPAPGLPPVIALRPQDANPIALLEESFVLSPGSLSSTPAHSHHNLAEAAYSRRQHRASLQYTQGFTRNACHHYSSSPGLRSSDMLSVISTARSSVLDPDEEIMEMMHAMEIQYQRQMEQKKSLEQYYTYAELPSIPSSPSSSSAGTDSTAATSATTVTSSTTSARPLATPKSDRPVTMYYADDSTSEYSEEGAVDTTGMYDDDDGKDDAIPMNDTNKNNMDYSQSYPQPTKGFPSIAVSPLPALPSQQADQTSTVNVDKDNDAVCLCPKHGVIVTRQ